MKENRAFLDNDRTAVFKCPKCDGVRTVDVSQYSKMDRFIRFVARCSCGHNYKVVLERRKHYRKKVKLAGKYSRVNGTQKFSILVRDLSRKGMGFEIWDRSSIRVGDRLSVEFQLDDDKQTVIRKDVIVQLISGESIGAEFYSTDPHNVYDKELGFYLL